MLVDAITTASYGRERKRRKVSAKNVHGGSRRETYRVEILYVLRLDDFHDATRTFIHSPHALVREYSICIY